MSAVINNLKRLKRKISAVSKHSKPLVWAQSVIQGEPVRVLALVYPDGKTLNILVEKPQDQRSVELELVPQKRDGAKLKLEVVNEGHNWIQFYGRIPVGVEPFRVQARRESNIAPLEDATDATDGQGHIRGRCVWLKGVEWESRFSRRAIHFGVNKGFRGASILKISSGLARINLRIGYGVEQNSTLPELVLRERKTKTRLSLPVKNLGSAGECVIDGSRIAALTAKFGSSRTVWDVIVEEERVKLGNSDIADPRAVFRFGWIKAESVGDYVKIRPYWTLDGNLALEIKRTTSVVS